MENEKNKKDWKNLLLRSGLPLEHDVADLLEKHKIYSYGEYSYSRINENGQQLEHSVDIDAEIRLAGVTLYFLIECKYRDPQKMWFFYPISYGRKELGQLQGDRLVKILECLSPARIDSKSFRRFESQLELCSKGVELLENKKSKDESGIKHGLFQLRYAIPNQVLNLALSQAQEMNDGNLDIKVIIPILVTTAALYVINENKDIKAIHNAKHIEEVAARVNSLVVYQEPAIDLLEYSEGLFEKVMQDPRILTRIKELNLLWNAHTKTESSLLGELRSNFNRSAAKILIVEYASLDTVIRKLLNMFKSAAKNLDKFAALKNDFDKHKSYFETKTWFEAYVQKSGSRSDE